MADKYANSVDSDKSLPELINEAKSLYEELRQSKLPSTIIDKLSNMEKELMESLDDYLRQNKSTRADTDKILDKNNERIKTLLSLIVHQQEHIASLQAEKNAKDQASGGCHAHDHGDRGDST